MYYNRNYEKLKLPKKKRSYLSHGDCAQVFQYENIVLKEYYSETSPNCRLSPEIFDILKNINNRHFIKLFDIYCDMDFSEILLYKLKMLPFHTEAYTAKYYIADSINVLYESVDYLLDNFKELELLFQTFTNNRIITEDVKKKNTVINSNGIIIIDPDAFYLSTDSQKTIAIANKKKLLNLLRSICINSSINQPHHGKIVTKTDIELLDIEIEENTDITYEISKKLKHVKKPIDYFMK